jgi:hypothetical protein
LKQNQHFNHQIVVQNLPLKKSIVTHYFKLK